MYYSPLLESWAASPTVLQDSPQSCKLDSITVSCEAVGDMEEQKIRPMPPKGRKRKAAIPQAEATASSGEGANDVKKLPKIRKNEGPGDLHVTIEH
ncbi:hypothetical protein NXF25_001464 [Crotalus adamanteus]|uniref:Uncharacterized protein n=1 Tax=Crotalus adamanteus TaxID=8729 RepID=A0AAW1C773_CROAD